MFDLNAQTPVKPAQGDLLPISDSSNSGNGGAVQFKEGVEQSLGTLTWTGTTPPSGSLSKLYKWERGFDNTVTLWFKITYGSAGSALTAVTFDLPADCPTPEAWSDASSGDSQYTGSGVLSTAIDAPSTNQRECFLAKNGSDWQVSIVQASSAYQYARGMIIYKAAS